MKITEAFPSKYLSANDIPQENIRVSMSHVETVELEGKKKLVLYFHKAKKGLMLNKTNASNIATAYGDDTDDWAGKEIILFTTWVDFQGKSVEAIRVRAPQPKDGAKPLSKPTTGPQPTRDVADEDVPF